MSLDISLERNQPMEVYTTNITHNLNRMADAAGIYQCLWRPEEVGITTASQLIPYLCVGLDALRGDPGRFQAMSPENGWGTYDQLLQSVATILAACQEYPDATVRVSR